MKGSLLKIMLLCSCLVFFASFPGHAQSEEKSSKTTLEGSVVRKLELSNGQFIETPVMYAVVKIENGGVTQETTIISTSGTFLFENLTPGEVKMSITSKTKDAQGNMVDEVEPFNESFPIVKGKNIMVVEMKPVEKGEDGGTLDAAVAVADSPLITFRNDTLVYNTNLINVQDGDFAIDILKQLPGVEVEGKRLKVLGENVARTYVNGALIFGYDPMDAMDYLKAENVASIESYTEDNPNDILSGRKSLRKQRVLNVKTHEPIVSVTDIQLTARGGVDGKSDEFGNHQLRYLTGFYGRFFSEMRQIRTDLAIDNLGLGTSLIMGAVPDAIATYAENANINIGYEQYWKNRLFGDGLQTSYSYGHTWTKDWSRALTERYENNGIPAQEEDIINTSSSRLNNHNFNVAYTLNTNPKLQFTWRSNVTIQDNATKRIRQGHTTIAGLSPMQTGQTVRDNDGSWKIKEYISFKKLKGSFNPNVVLQVDAGHSDRDSWDIDTLSSSYLKRYLTKDGNEVPITTKASISHSILSIKNTNKPLSLSGAYEIGYSRKKSIQTSYDMYGVPEPVLNFANTFDYTASTFSNKGNINYSANFLGFSLSGDLALESDKIIDMDKIPEASTVSRTFWSFLPSVTIIPTNPEKIMQRTFMIRYEALPVLPSVEQIRNRINDANQIYLYGGNPDLKKGTVHNVSMNYSKYSLAKIKSASLNATANISVQTNPIIHRAQYFGQSADLPQYNNYHIPAGAILNTYENAKASLSADTYLTLSKSLRLFNGKFKPSLNITQRNRYSDRQQYFGNDLDRTHEFTPSISLSSNYTINASTRYSFRTEESYTHVWNSSDVLVRNLMNTTSFSLTKQFLNYLSSEIGYSITTNSYLKGELDGRTIQRLRISIGADLLHHNLNISISGNDLLNGGSIYSITSGPASITQTWRPVYGRFYLLNVTYRFNSSGGKKTFFNTKI